MLKRAVLTLCLLLPFYAGAEPPGGLHPSSPLPGFTIESWKRFHEEVATSAENRVKKFSPDKVLTPEQMECLRTQIAIKKLSVQHILIKAARLATADAGMEKARQELQQRLERWCKDDDQGGPNAGLIVFATSEKWVQSRIEQMNSKPGRLDPLPSDFWVEFFATAPIPRTTENESKLQAVLRGVANQPPEVRTSVMWMIAAGAASFFISPIPGLP